MVNVIRNGFNQGMSSSYKCSSREKALSMNDFCCPGFLIFMQN